MSDALHGYRDIWKRKPVLRAIYDDFYDRIAAACIPGMTIEIGGGIGNLKERRPDVVATDVQFAPWLDCVANAQRLPFAAGVAANIVMVDVLHHVEFPYRFFSEAGRVLRNGGRIIMIEPAVTWGSTLFYRLLHEEPVRASADPLMDGTPDPHRDPYAANQAIPTLIATRHRTRFHRLFPELRIITVNWFSFAVYPMSGGFKRWCLVPARAVRTALSAERFLEPLLGSIAGFRMMLVIERATGPAAAGGECVVSRSDWTKRGG
jgi:SAM-dependent methyltransferase